MERIYEIFGLIVFITITFLTIMVWIRGWKIRAVVAAFSWIPASIWMVGVLVVLKQLFLLQGWVIKINWEMAFDFCMLMSFAINVVILAWMYLHPRQIKCNLCNGTGYLDRILIRWR